jgi:hypothetical protein
MGARKKPIKGKTYAITGTSFNDEISFGGRFCVCGNTSKTINAAPIKQQANITSQSILLTNREDIYLPSAMDSIRMIAI